MLRENRGEDRKDTNVEDFSDLGKRKGLEQLPGLLDSTWKPGASFARQELKQNSQ